MANGPDLDRQQEYYTGRWNSFEKANHLDLARAVRILQYLLRVELPASAKVCDMGCGAGWLTNVLGTFVSAHGIDLSDVSHARLRYPSCTFETIDAASWNPPQGEFDLVTSIEVIEHLEADRQPAYLRVIRDCLKPGGYLILTTPNARTMEVMGGRAYSNQPIENWLEARQLRALLAADFELLDFDSLVFAGYRGAHRLVNSAKLRSGFQALGLLRSWEHVAGKLGFGLHFSVLARRRD